MLIKKENYKRATWKNGLGFTDEIAIYPPESSLVKGDFLWRLSSARIERASPFSLFPAHDRVLLILKGNAIRMIHTFEEGEPPEVVEIPELEPYEFPGDVPSKCELLDGPITDFSIFARTGEVSVNYRVQRISSDEEFVWDASGRWNFAFAIGGEIKTDEVFFSEGDTLSVQTSQVIMKSVTNEATLFLICFD